MNRICEGCGGDIPTVRRSGARFCTNECYLSRRGRGPKSESCLTCGGSMAARSSGSKFCTVKCKNAHHNAKQDHHLRMYGIPRAEVLRMAAAQGGCAVCGGSSTDWVVDHDHSCCSGVKTCGECVRGVLCRLCNGGLGMFNDNVEALMSAVAYLLSGQDVLTAKPVLAIS